jgi:hypothetical protein
MSEVLNGRDKLEGVCADGRIILNLEVGGECEQDPCESSIKYSACDLQPVSDTST